MHAIVATLIAGLQNSHLPAPSRLFTSNPNTSCTQCSQLLSQSMEVGQDCGALTLTQRTAHSNFTYLHCLRVMLGGRVQGVAVGERVDSVGRHEGQLHKGQQGGSRKLCRGDSFDSGTGTCLTAQLKLKAAASSNAKQCNLARTCDQKTAMLEPVTAQNTFLLLAHISCFNSFLAVSWRARSM